jgi:hypothetical protein
MVTGLFIPVKSCKTLIRLNLYPSMFVVSSISSDIIVLLYSSHRHISFNLAYKIVKICELICVATIGIKEASSDCVYRGFLILLIDSGIVLSK